MVSHRIIEIKGVNKCTAQRTNNTWHIAGAKYLTVNYYTLPTLLVLISELKISLPSSQHKGYSTKAGLKYQRIVKGKGHSLNWLSKVEKFDSLDVTIDVSMAISWKKMC